ncbi:uncharacterized protein LOC131885083 [Tigriopus californicus]|uniref:uncharacterized protein LOC131885083 n=1 Tax=Tigriopus californicus TaxID=6832 RepID=UPI0027DA29AC|nr:uncharacterized protein LOC131885083 [Tigriopus californicus]
MRWALAILLGGLIVLNHHQASGMGLPRIYKEAMEEDPNEVKDEPAHASRVGMGNRALLSRFNMIGVRSLRGPPPLMEMSPIILPLEQRALWRNVAPPQLRSMDQKYYNKVNPVLYDMLVNRK